jgi:uncharacterized protein (TIGR02118 family)
MTYQLTVLYGQPDDPAAFDAYYEQTHAPLAEKLEGLESFTASKPEPGRGGEPASVYFIAELRFADQATFAAAMSGEHGRAAADDVANFATGGATLLTGEVTSYV